MSQTTTLENVMDRVDEMSKLHSDEYIKVNDIAFTSLDTVMTCPPKTGPVIKLGLGYNKG